MADLAISAPRERLFLIPARLLSDILHTMSEMTSAQMEGRLLTELEAARMDTTARSLAAVVEDQVAHIRK